MMIYPSDYYQSSKMKSPINIVFSKRISRVDGMQERFENTKKPIKMNRHQVSIWERYCSSSTVHGFKYLSSDANLHWCEKLTWALLITIAGIGIIYLSFLLQIRFSSNRLATVVESTFYPIFEIPYPAVTICNYNRINGERVDAAIELFLPNASTENTEKLIDVLIGLNVFEFGSFDEFHRIHNVSLQDLEHININALYRNLVHECSELFVKPCWWRNKYVDCCEIFSEQKSEYGICYAFNSATNAVGRRKLINETNYPWRTSSYGDYSGLRLEVNVNDSTKIKGIETQSGILIMVHHPMQWPDYAYFIPAGTQTTVVIKPTFSYATSDVNWLSIHDRDCVFPDEIIELKIKSLAGLRYMRPNCISECRQAHSLKLCNCTLEFLFSANNYTKCNISALQCLYKYDDLFNYQKPPEGSPYFSDSEKGMICNCMHECELIDYGIEISQLLKGNYDNMIDTNIMLDVHFQQANMVRYRTSVVFNWIDLLVAFGGIAGLFLGCSLLSIAEAVLYFAFYLVDLLRKGKRLTTTDKDSKTSVIKVQPSQIQNI